MPDLLGDAKSGRPLAVGASRADVLRLLGTPVRQTRNGGLIAYSFQYVRGYWIGFTGFGLAGDDEGPFDPIPRFRCYTAVIAFNRERLYAYALRENDVWQAGGIDSQELNEMMPASANTVSPSPNSRHTDSRP